MDFVSRMTALLSELRRERNGVVADCMRFYGRACGLNLGVSIPTVRTIAGAECRDHEFARYLYKQDVRELRIAALQLAEPDKMSPDELPFWAEGVVNSEIAEQAAMLLFSRIGWVDTLLERWGMAENLLLVHCALMAAARSAECSAGRVLAAVEHALQSFPDDRLAAQSAVAAAVALAGRSPREVKAFVSTLRAESPAASYFLDEVSWQIA